MATESDGRISPALIAIVDDDADVRVSLEALVLSTGLSAMSFETADALLASPTLRQANCIISDVQLPGTSGVQLARRVHAELGTPVILITAYPNEIIEQQAHEAEVLCFLRKPFDPSIIIDHLTRMFG
ncbi:response regulator [Azorhizobium oxalatiphilum]|uniref:Response regulator n=1 Tax=Azorhizobium oxalatiphilum TaxID=980631 RepID=A0A917FJG5_9HYPH|nr:response regulator [Azorhizobium oxalatiphilum]GGF86092.1 response regulator [Azorhizobium oxalatiphilum]